MTSRLVAQLATALVLSIPPLTGLYALVTLDRFRRGAFGLYAKGAAGFMVAIAAGLLYYTLVVILLWRQGSIEETWTHPFGPTGALLILQSLAAAVTLGALGFGATRFLSIVEPDGR